MSEFLFIDEDPLGDGQEPCDICSGYGCPGCRDDNGAALIKTDNGCDDCSVEPGETHRYPHCPGNVRARTQETHR